mmetsp:Transcript_48425/g.148977  ORF Transcript_48425/g.148977 Transcript_48425/m.148977 type:complete len:271 (+) Transcript_48425:568-1380(+)
MAVRLPRAADGIAGAAGVGDRGAALAPTLRGESGRDSRRAARPPFVPWLPAAQDPRLGLVGQGRVARRGRLTLARRGRVERVLPLAARAALRRQPRALPRHRLAPRSAAAAVRPRFLLGAHARHARRQAPRPHKQEAARAPAPRWSGRLPASRRRPHVRVRGGAVLCLRRLLRARGVARRRPHAHRARLRRLAPRFARPRGAVPLAAAALAPACRDEARGGGGRARRARVRGCERLARGEGRGRARGGKRAVGAGRQLFSAAARREERLA